MCVHKCVLKKTSFILLPTAVEIVVVVVLEVVVVVVVVVDVVVVVVGVVDVVVVASDIGLLVVDDCIS